MRPPVAVIEAIRHNRLIHSTQMFVLLLLLALGSAVRADSPPPAEPAGEVKADTEAVQKAEGEETQATEESDQSEDPEAGLVAVAFQNAELTQIAQFFMHELGKPVIIHEKIKDKKISIMAEDKLPRAEAFEVIGNALRQQGVMVLEGRKQIELLPIEEARRVSRRVVAADETVADIEDQSQVVDKVFELKHYDVIKLKDVILPMLPDYAFVLADPNINRLIVTDAAANLVRIEQLVDRLDVPSSGKTIERIFQIEDGDASEIVSMVRTIIAGQLGDRAKEVFSAGAGKQSGPDKQKDAAERVVFVERSNTPIVLQADISRNWIMAVASPAVMEQIERWIKELDKPKTREEPFELMSITHADIGEMAGQISETLKSLPDQEVRNSVRVIPFIKSRQLLVYGSQNGRDLVRSLIEQLDVETATNQVMKEFPLKYDSAENVKKKIEELLGEKQASRSRYTYYFGSQQKTQPKLTVTADTQRNSVTVMTDPVKMRRIEELISEQWDRPIDLESVQPRVYRLKYSDPVLVKTLLENMFTRSKSKTTFNWWSDTINTENSDPVGRLFGQFSFEALRGSDKLIVSSKSVENFKVIDDLIAEIDQPETAGLPTVIELKHANAEDIAEQLNAMFAEPNTLAQIRRTKRGLSEELRRSVSSETGGNAQRNQQNNGNDGQAGQDDMVFWWAQSRPKLDEQPTSNLIGKPRFVPVNRRNALMIMAPTAHIEPFIELIDQLDKPGDQVVLHAIITAIQHDDESTLGVRLASDPSILNDSRLSDQSVGGSLGIDVTRGIFGDDGILNADMNLNVLLQLLIKNVNLRILNEPRVYTADNQEAHFFDGQDVPVILSDQTSRDSGITFNRSFNFRSVGTRLHIRPHITQEGDVDMEVNLELSRIVNGTSVFGNFIFDRRETTTHVTVQDGQTIVISGIVRQEDFEDVRKLPLLGDLPWIGGAFRSTDKGVRNQEVIAFITPRIIRMGSREADELSDQNRQWIDRLRNTMRVPKNQEAATETVEDEATDATSNETIDETPSEASKIGDDDQVQ